MKKKFAKDYLTNTLGLPDVFVIHKGKPPVTVHENRIVDHSRWSLHFVLVFSIDDGPDANKPGEAWEVTYSRGATECQMERPWDDADEVEATLVRLVEKTVKVWEPVAAEG